MQLKTQSFLVKRILPIQNIGSTYHKRTYKNMKGVSYVIGYCNLFL
jgi:hypothetical protein